MRVTRRPRDGHATGSALRTRAFGHHLQVRRGGRSSAPAPCWYPGCRSANIEFLIRNRNAINDYLEASDDGHHRPIDLRRGGRGLRGLMSDLPPVLADPRRAGVLAKADTALHPRTLSRSKTSAVATATPSCSLLPAAKSPTAPPRGNRAKSRVTSALMNSTPRGSPVADHVGQVRDTGHDLESATAAPRARCRTGRCHVFFCQLVPCPSAVGVHPMSELWYNHGSPAPRRAEVAPRETRETRHPAGDSPGGQAHLAPE